MHCQWLTGKIHQRHFIGTVVATEAEHLVSLVRPNTNHLAADITVPQRCVSSSSVKSWYKAPPWDHHAKR